LPRSPCRSCGPIAPPRNRDASDFQP
jgi:hypothetical protein